MVELWVLMLLTLILCWIYERAYVCGKSTNFVKSKINSIFPIIVVILGGYLGLRTSYNDTFTYLHAYDLTQPFPEFWSGFEFSLSGDPGFEICNALFKTWNISPQTWLMIYAVTTVALYITFLKKNYNSLILNIFLFFCVGSYTFAGAAIKQSIATAICFWALSYALQQKWEKYCLCVLLAMMFHVYAIIFLCVPFLMFKPWTRRTLVMLVGTVAIAFSLQSLLGAIVQITTSVGEGYTAESFAGEGVNVLRVLVCNMPTILGFLFRDRLFDNASKRECLFYNMSMINGCIMFIGLFGTANYFARLANYFVLAQAITLPWIIQRLGSRRNKRFLSVGIIVGYLGYFYYATNVVYGTFNMHRITVWEFLKQLF